MFIFVFNQFVHGDLLVTGALNTAIVTIMLVVTTPMVPVQTECVQQDGEHIHAAKVFKMLLTHALV